MKNQPDAVIERPRRGLPAFLATLSSPKMSLVRKGVHILFMLLAFLGVFLQAFMPICTLDSYWLTPFSCLWYLSALGNPRPMTIFVIVALIVLFLLIVAWIVAGLQILLNLFGLRNEEKVAARAKRMVIFCTVVTAVMTVVSFVCAPVFQGLFINTLAGQVNTLFLPIPLVYIVLVSLAYAGVMGLFGSFRQKLEEEQVFEAREWVRRKKQIRLMRGRKIELLIYVLFSSILTVTALLSNFLTVVFQDAALPQYSLTGWNLLLDWSLPTTTEGERLIAFIVFSLLVSVLTSAFVSLMSFFGRSSFYTRIGIATIVLNSVVCLTVGLFGQYYSMVQILSTDLLAQILEARYSGLGIFMQNILENASYTVSSRSIWFFFDSLAVVAVVLIRRPYTKVKTIEAALEAEDAAKLTHTIEIAAPNANAQGNKIADGEGDSLSTDVANIVFDPCPALTELDRKRELYRSELERKRQAVFEDPTLPRLVDFIVQYARDSRHHLFYTPEHIAAFLAGMGTTRLTILQGMSGTGKTSLPKIVAEALYSVCDIIEVESAWRDKNELLGYYNEFNRVYTPKKFTQALYRANLNPEVVTFIVLDEMNLSRIEYYFSDFLSLMENEPDKREIKLLNVPLMRENADGLTEYAALREGHTLKVPANVWFIGTANRDESTYDISDKVYDRAHTMNFDKRAAKVQYYNESIPARYLPAEELNRMFEEAKTNVKFSLDQYPVIAEVEKLLAPYNISFGNRVAMQMESFVSIYASCFTANDAIIHDALETILLSKVVRKLELKNVEDKDFLADEFAKLNLSRCSAFIRGLQED